MAIGIFRRYILGVASPRDLATELHELDVRRRWGKRVSVNIIDHILHCPIYIGTICIRSTGEVFRRRHDPVVARSLFDLASICLIIAQTRFHARKPFPSACTMQ